MPSASSPFSRPSQLGVLAISVVHWVSASTNTRSKNSSSGVTCSFSRITALTRGAWLDGELLTRPSLHLEWLARRGRWRGGAAARGLAVFPRGPDRRLSPQLLQPIELARLRREDVHDDVQIVHQDPARLARSLNAAGQQFVLALQPLEDAVVNRLRLTAGVARTDQEEVRVAEHTPQVELHHIHCLL